MRNELKFLLSFPFGQRLEMMQRLHQLHLKKVLSKHETMGMNSLFRQHTHLIHVYSSPCQCLSRKDTGASCLTHISQETIVRAEVDMTGHTHTCRQAPWTDTACWDLSILHISLRGHSAAQDPCPLYTD